MLQENKVSDIRTSALVTRASEDRHAVRVCRALRSRVAYAIFRFTWTMWVTYKMNMRNGAPNSLKRTRRVFTPCEQFAVCHPAKMMSSDRDVTRSKVPNPFPSYNIARKSKFFQVQPLSYVWWEADLEKFQALALIILGLVYTTLYTKKRGKRAEQMSSQKAFIILGLIYNTIY